MRREGEERLRTLGGGLTKVKMNLHKKRAAMLKNKADFTGKTSAVMRDSRNLLGHFVSVIRLCSVRFVLGLRHQTSPTLGLN